MYMERKFEQPKVCRSHKLEGYPVLMNIIFCEHIFVTYRSAMNTCVVFNYASHYIQGS